ncbi:hypothetical protein C4D60_Mb09t08780 [Musa balbisiana]|uniref:Mitochondrial import receptor subunit TOM6 homolog n=1 Tax=Musa balbisiana TaxID=52838 RepID=A0A4S8IF08_MUSBA|nr:hypothetical protein C4D60_Mb09t08780 [Musa balbisiana]
MFLGGFPRRPDNATAYKKLKTHLTIMGAWIAVIRVTPYLLVGELEDFMERRRVAFPSVK